MRVCHGPMIHPQAIPSKLRNISLDPQLEKRIIKGYNIPICIYKITSYQCLLNPLYICRTFQMILIQNLSTRKSRIDTIRHRYEEILLVNRHGFHITLIEQAILIQKFIDSLFYHLVCNLRTSLIPCEPGQMLD